MALIVDAHQHFWREDAPFLNEAWGSLCRTFAPEDLAPELAEAGVDGTVIVQSDHSYTDTESMLRQAAENDFVLGVVGWIPLLDVGESERALDRFCAHREFCGVRHLTHMLPDPDWLLQDELLPGLRLLAERDLSFDVVSVQPRHLENVSVLADRIPELNLVVDHLSKPPIREKGWEPWATLLGRAAERPNVYAKISGLNTAADHESWSAAELQPYVDHALEVFEPRRLMFGSDWPVATVAGDYQKVWRATNEVLAQLSDGEREAVLGGTAIQFYGLER